MKRILFGCVILISLASCEQKKEVSGGNRGDASVKVKIEKVKKFTEAMELGYSGTVEAYQAIPLSFQGRGTVKQVLVEEGDKVREGQLLATLDEADMESSYRVARAMFEQANDAYGRMKQVYDKGSLPEIKWVEVSANLEQAKVQLDLAKSRLEKCKLFAPLSGIIGNRNVEPGQASAAGMPPFVLMKIDKVLINFSVPENEIESIEKGQTAIARVSALENKDFSGVISHVGVVANPYARTYRAKLTVQNTGRTLKPGMVCDVTIKKETDEAWIVVPYTAVTTDDQGNTFVYTISPESTKARKQIVEVGSYRSNGLVIRKGLSVNQRVVVEGKEKLTDSTPINISL